MPAVVKLDKSLYGLHQAACEWRNKVRANLVSEDEDVKAYIIWQSNQQTSHLNWTMDTVSMFTTFFDLMAGSMPGYAHPPGNALTIRNSSRSTAYEDQWDN